MKNSKKIFLLQSGLYGKDSTDLTMSFISEQGALKYAFKENSKFFIVLITNSIISSARSEYSCLADSCNLSNGISRCSSCLINNSASLFLKIISVAF